jgi:hypothetical protein
MCIVTKPGAPNGAFPDAGNRETFWSFRDHGRLLAELVEAELVFLEGIDVGFAGAEDEAALAAQVAGFIKGLDDPRPDVRWRAAFALGRMGEMGSMGGAGCIAPITPMIPITPSRALALAPLEYPRSP